MAKFILGKKSLNELQGVHPALVTVVQRAIEITAQDFGVHDGIRTLDEQRQLVAQGASQTLDSRHITGHAVDLVPVINGKLRWEWPPIFLIADAMRLAARESGMRVRWGGAWDVDFTAAQESPEDLVAGYVARRKAAGLRAFIDGPHFELSPDEYPQPK